MRALIVEDSAAVQSFHKLALGRFEGLTIDVAGDGVAALKQLAEHRYDVVLLDINLPLMDGMKVLASLKKKGGPEADTPVIMVTSEGDSVTVQRARELGAFRVLTKPITAHALRDALSAALGLAPA